MEKEKFIPSGPYVFQSGNHRGQSIEVLMFKDYGFVRWYLRKMDLMMGGKRNRLHQHVDWVVRQGENRNAKWLCPQCAHDSPIQNFLALGHPTGGYTISLQLTSCERQECLENLFYLKKRITDKILPVRFSSILQFNMKADRDQVARFLRDAFELPKRLTKESAFRFFSE